MTGYGGSPWGNPVRSYTKYDDAFVAKFDASGNLVWNTFLGGASADHGSGIALDSSGNVCVTGYSNGAWGTPVRAYSGNYDGFAAKLDSSGNLLWSTFLGAANADYCQVCF